MTLPTWRGPPASLDLVRRCERAQARSSLLFSEAATRVRGPDACPMLACCGGTALFFGAGSPVSRTVGMCVEEAIDDQRFEAVVAFFRGHGTPVRVELTFASDPSFLDRLGRFRLRVADFVNAHVRSLGDGDRLRASIGSEGVTVEPVHPADIATADGYDDAVGRGFTEGAPVPPLMQGINHVAMAKPDGCSVLARCEGRPAGGGRVEFVSDSRGGKPVALLLGASTLPEFRRRGVQGALVRARLKLAAERGCDMALVQARAGSGSERNIVRAGFELAYGKVIMTEPSNAGS